MKILLLGEYSGIFRNLKEGLFALGHDVKIASRGDNWKKIKNDIALEKNLPGTIGKFQRRIYPFTILDKLTGYDVVQIINPFIFPHDFGINETILKKVIVNNDKTFLSAAGTDPVYFDSCNLILRYSPIESFKRYDLKIEKHPYETKAMHKWNDKLSSLVHGIIPIMYEYQVGYKNCKNCKNIIPMPINTDNIGYNSNRILGKIVVFHGLNREGFKGSHMIKAAMQRVRDDYPDEVEIIIDGKLPLNEYLKILNKSNIVIDQAYSYSYGMNALYAMAMGKIVFSGSEPESLKAFGIKENPVVNILPDENQIYNKLKYFIENKNMIPEWGLSSRKYAEVHHHYKTIAKKYLNIWSS